MVILTHSSNNDMFLTNKGVKVLGGTTAENNPRTFLIWGINCLPQTISIFVPTNPQDEKIHLTVGIENKDEGEVIYSSKKVEYDIEDINKSFKKMILKGSYTEFYLITRMFLSFLDAGPPRFIS